VTSAGAGYFDTLGLRLVRGRAISPEEDIAGAPVCVVNDRFAALPSAGGMMVGGTIRVESSGRWLSVVGVVADVAGEHRILAPVPAVYVPFGAGGDQAGTLLIRSSTNATEMARQLTQAFADEPGDRIVFASMAEQLSSEIAGSRFVIELIVIFTVTAMMLAGLGLASAMVWYVQDRRREIAIRLAIGAHPRMILWFVGKRAFALIVTGATIGAFVAATSTWFGWRQLAYSSVFEPMLWASLLASVVAFATVALYVPARTAVRVEPVSELRAV
jgi:putative ABC transport system permease protein